MPDPLPTPTPDADQNLLFGVLCLQTDLIAEAQFVEICSLWATRKNVPLGNLLLEGGWITDADNDLVNALVARKLQKHGGDPRQSLAGNPPVRFGGRAELNRLSLPLSPERARAARA